MHIDCHLTARSEIGKIFNSNNYGGKRIIVVQFILRNFHCLLFYR